MKSVIFIAPPASGKGTQSQRLIELGYKHISAGDMLRCEINKGSKLGLNIKSLMASGSLVSDEIVFELINQELKNNTKPFILDGFPRTINQVQLLDKLFKELNINNYEVIYLSLGLEEALKRTLGRLTCKCGASYNINYENLKPKVENICDICGSELVKRDDDNEESFKTRFNTFVTNIEPIIEFYKNEGKLHIIDASKDYKIIADEIKEILK